MVNELSLCTVAFEVTPHWMLFFLVTSIKCYSKGCHTSLQRLSYLTPVAFTSSQMHDSSGCLASCTPKAITPHSKSYPTHSKCCHASLQWLSCLMHSKGCHTSKSTGCHASLQWLSHQVKYHSSGCHTSLQRLSHLWVHRLSCLTPVAFTSNHISLQ